MTSVLIDASNLHVGGGVQVAGSFLDELARLTREVDRAVTWPSALQVEASTEVMAQLSPETVKTLRPIAGDRHPNQWRRWIPRKPRFDVSFVVFGPEWGYRRAASAVVGFADVTAVFPRPPSLEPLTGFSRAERALHGSMSRWLHSRASLLITETEYTAEALGRTLPRVPDIEVVPNTANSIFSTPSRWKLAPPMTVKEGHYSICYVARPYDHKNHGVLPEAARQLRQRFGLNVEFIVTLTDDEWAGLSSRDSLVNVGPVSVEQIPALLQACNASILPTLLESFSVTPLEAFAMQRPLFASDRGFIRDSCNDAPFYFDPESPADIADVLAHALTNRDLMAEHVERGSHLLANHITPRERAIRYMQILHEAANGKK